MENDNFTLNRLCPLEDESGNRNKLFKCLDIMGHLKLLGVTTNYF